MKRELLDQLTAAAGDPAPPPSNAVGANAECGVRNLEFGTNKKAEKPSAFLIQNSELENRSAAPARRAEHRSAADDAPGACHPERSEGSFPPSGGDGKDPSTPAAPPLRMTSEPAAPADQAPAPSDPVGALHEAPGDAAPPPSNAVGALHEAPADAAHPPSNAVGEGLAPPADPGTTTAGGDEPRPYGGTQGRAPVGAGAPAPHLRDHLAALAAEAAAIPGFDLAAALRDPAFVRLTAPGVGVGVRRAWLALHPELLERRAAADYRALPRSEQRRLKQRICDAAARGEKIYP